MDPWRDPEKAPDMPTGTINRMYTAFSRYMEHREGKTTAVIRRHITDRLRKYSKATARKISIAEAMLDYIMDKELDKDWVEHYGRLLCSLIAQPDKLIFDTIWDGSFSVWTTLFVEDIVRIPGEHRKYKTTFLALTGPAAGCRMTGDYNPAFLNSLLRRCGWDPPAYREPSPVELGGLIFSTMFNCGEGGDVSFLYTHVQPAHRTFNKDLMSVRGGTCIHPEGKDMPCGYCRIGRTECPRSMHKFTYPKGLCRNTHVIHEGALTPSGWCLTCLEKGFIKDERERGKEYKEAGNGDDPGICQS